VIFLTEKDTRLPPIEREKLRKGFEENVQENDELDELEKKILEKEKELDDAYAEYLYTLSKIEEKAREVKR
jgi:hypothetical protein